MACRKLHSLQQVSYAVLMSPTAPSVVPTTSTGMVGETDYWKWWEEDFCVACLRSLIVQRRSLLLVRKAVLGDGSSRCCMHATNSHHACVAFAAACVVSISPRNRPRAVTSCTLATQLVSRTWFANSDLSHYKHHNEEQRRRIPIISTRSVPTDII
jgi:hypothetical protein